MFPNNEFSSENVPSGFVLTRPLDRLSDNSWGGIALQDSSLGLQYQIWTLRWDSLLNQLLLSAPNYPETVLLNITRVTHIGLSFDQNMNIIYLYRKDGITYLNWYDSTISGRRVSQFAGISYPCICLDDFRDIHRVESDVIFAYINQQFLCYRLQRDRYLTEYRYPTTLGPGARLVQIGMATNYRFQFEVTRRRN